LCSGYLSVAIGFSVCRRNREFHPAKTTPPLLREIVKKEIESGDATVPGDNKIGSRVSWWFAGSAGYPSNPSGITHFLGRGEGLIFEIWMGRFYRTSDTINLVTLRFL
jgi:hypothetical protein